MDPTEPVPRGEFNAGMQGIRAALADLKENMVDRTARIEGKQDAASAAALGAAREAGRTDARISALEVRAGREWQLWTGVVLALIAAAARWLLGG